MERDSVSFVSECGKAENGCVDKPHVDRCVCVSVCDTGFGATQLSCVLGLIILTLV